MATLDPKKIFIDGAAAGGGDGSVGTPYNNISTAISSEAEDTTNGTALCIKGTVTLTDDITDDLTAAGWAPGYAAPLYIIGYGATYDDGVDGIIDGDALFSIETNSALDHVLVKNVSTQNHGSRSIANVNNKWVLLTSRFGGTTGQGMLVDADSVCIGNYFHDADTGYQTVGPSFVWGNIASGPSLRCFDPTQDVLFMFNSAHAGSGSALGVNVGQTAYAINNSFFSAGGTGTGLASRKGTAGTMLANVNNVVAGFSGVGGIGIDEDETSPSYTDLRGGNAVYDCATNVAPATSEALIDLEDETLGAAPFTDADNLDFSPVDTGSVNSPELGFHTGLHANNKWVAYKGAVQPSAGGSGNELALYPGAVQQAVTPSGGGGGGRNGPGLSFGMMGKMGA